MTKTKSTVQGYAQDGAIGMKMQTSNPRVGRVVERGATGMPIQRITPQSKPTTPAAPQRPSNKPTK